jgi:hypothetical protein
VAAAAIAIRAGVLILIEVVTRSSAVRDLNLRVRRSAKLVEARYW